MACLLPLGMQAQQGTFRFAQLTDIHLTPNNPNPTEDLLRSVAQINATDSIDFVLVTGDLTEEGDRTTMEKVKSCLDLLKVPYHVVLGNHETKWSDSGCTAFGEIFGGERFEFEHKGFLFLGFNSGPLMRMAYGHVVPQDIRWMTEEMDKNGKDKPVILVTHYPLMEGDVDNWYEVTDAVRPYNVRLFIGGHYHSNRDLRYDGIPGVLMRSNLCDKEGKPGYGIYEVTGDSIRVYTQRIGEPKKQWTAFSLTGQYYDRNGKAEKYKCQVDSYEETEKMITYIMDKYKRIDILINNAGITKDGLIMRMKEEDFDRVIDVNLKGTFNCIRHVSRYMLKQRSGRIINMSSVVGIAGNAGQVNYSASKAGVIGITKSAAKELASRGITVNAVAPGYIDTDMTKVLSEEQKKSVLDMIPLSRMGSVDDISNAVAFLASDEAAYITGQVISVDGGMNI